MSPRVASLRPLMSSEEAFDQVQLIVVGFHRSGTSLATQLLHAGGLFVGDDLLGAMPSNPYGHFEDRAVLELHRQVMDDHGVGWQVTSPQLFTLSREHWARMEDLVALRESQHRNWGFKDPRVCFFLGAWKFVMPDAKFLIVYRDPSDCARSLETRHAREFFDGSGDGSTHLRFFKEPDLAFRSWNAHNRAVLAFAKRNVDDCLVVPSTHLNRGVPLISMVNKRFGADLDEVTTQSVFDPNATSSREVAQWVHDPTVAEDVQRTWAELELLNRITEE